MKKLTLILICVVVLGWLISCSDDKTPLDVPDVTLAKMTCEQCHADQAALTALATPEPPPSGESGEG